MLCRFWFLDTLLHILSIKFDGFVRLFSFHGLFGTKMGMKWVKKFGRIHSANQQLWKIVEWICRKIISFSLNLIDIPCSFDFFYYKLFSAVVGLDGVMVALVVVVEKSALVTKGWLPPTHSTLVDAIFWTNPWFFNTFFFEM